LEQNIKVSNRVDVRIGLYRKITNGSLSMEQYKQKNKIKWFHILSINFAVEPPGTSIYSSVSALKHYLL